MPTRRTTRHTALVLSAVLGVAPLTGCALLDAAGGCEGADGRVRDVAALDILDSRPDGAAVARGFEKVDAGCWADSGDVVVYADRTYAFPGTREDVTAHYRTSAVRDGWNPGPEDSPGGMCFTREDMSLRLVFLTAEILREDGHGSRPDLTTGAGYSVSVETYLNDGVEAGC
ncbi:hypothetical protein IF129_01000 [Streptomyces chumphonensis]|uniref:Lipoprotein n=1 Tax=Streptomyces chumphonensis TaxID=1214925 RepID=A0A927IAS4_9ACTN|nr:hypothetical protein [Streptomyces chumphonensis]